MPVGIQLERQECRPSCASQRVIFSLSKQVLANDTSEYQPSNTTWKSDPGGGTFFPTRDREDDLDVDQNLWHRTPQPCRRRGSGNFGQGITDLALLRYPEKPFRLD